VVQSQEDERAHLSRDLHDGTSQTLASIGLMLESAIDQLEREPGSGLPAVLNTALSRLHGASAEVRRISHRLRPTLLDTLGLPAALRHLGEEFCQHSGVLFSMTHDGEPIDLPEDVKTVFFRVAQEALTNIEKHAAAARIDMHLSFGSRELQLAIRDDGRGFETESVRQHPRRGIGLRNMRERLDSIGGRWSVTSKAGCTEVCAQLPLNAAIFREPVRA
jgi:two-component system NarL family sensor kinase